MSPVRMISDGFLSFDDSSTDFLKKPIMEENMPWDVNRAIQHLRTHVLPESKAKCATYTREAIGADGIRLMNTRSAKDYGSPLKASGFREVPSTGPFRAGDVAIIQPVTGHPAGYMCMFDGSIWISDFKQLRGLYPGPAYRHEKPSYKIYRHP